jgi:hypothetical protein
MRTVLLAAVAVTGFGLGLAASATPAQAGQFPICLHWKGDFVECRYSSMAQCMASASGIGADCLPNPAYAGYYVEEPAPPRRVRRHHRED